MIEKYAVVLDNEKTKQASSSKHCPLCNRLLEELDGKPWCPTHGYEPFEKRPPKE
jgi:uncharacterized Zn finger protein (UPF0148 family)